MPERMVVVGVAGAGKTSKAMDVIEEKLRSGVKWNEIGFCSFSRAACAEAAARASKITGVDADKLRNEGWFRTIHSCAFKLLGVDSKMLIDHDAKSGRDFVEEACGAPRGGDKGTLGHKIDEALTYWDTSRATLARMIGKLSQSDTGLTGKLSQSDKDLVPWVTSDDARIQSKPHDTTTHLTDCQMVPFADYSCSEAPERGSNLAPYTRIESLENSEPEKIISPMGVEHTELLHFSDPPIEIIVGKGTERQSVRGVVSDDGFDCHQVSSFVTQGERDESHMVDPWLSKGDFELIIKQYEQQKRYSGHFDFTDILFRYAGIEVTADLMFRECYPLGSTPPDLQVILVDEYQDCSRLLDKVAQRLSGGSGELWMLGDRYQAVYGFSGSDHRVFAAREDEARSGGRRILLNKSYRNPECVIEWGEDVLHEDSEYESRTPFSGKHEGSVGMMEAKKFIAGLSDLADTDTMILCRAWFGLERIMKELDEKCIPWKSCQDKRSSKWESPVKIAMVLTFKALMAGEKISEQDWRRLTENIPMKVDGLEIFKRGEKARWKKMECSGDNVFAIDQVGLWGAGDGFHEFVIEEKWRKDQLLLLDIAIEKYGIDIVRSPRIKLGSCHSVKGMQARNVFCLATTSQKADEGDFYEDLFLKYVTITRASMNYRVVVDLVDHGRGRPLFLACPKGYWKFERSLPDDLREIDSVEDCAVGEQTAGDVDRQIPGVDLRNDRGAGSDTLRQREVCQPGSESREGQGVTDSGTAAEEDSFSEWDLGSGSKFG